MNRKIRNSLIMGILSLQGMLCLSAGAGEVEFSFGGSLNRSNYTGEDFSWTRRWGASIGYYFLDRSEIEFSFQDVTDRTKIVGYEDTTFHDQIYSVNWVQMLAGRNFPVQPYAKVGIGQLNRSAIGTYANGASPNPQLDSLTGVLGAGLRIFLSKGFAIRTEATSYLAGGNINKWHENFAFTVGASLYF